MSIVNLVILSVYYKGLAIILHFREYLERTQNNGQKKKKL